MGEETSAAKIFVDSDWKEEARREKERLAEQEAAAQGRAAVPAAGFLELVNMLATQAVVSIGGYQLPTGEVVPPDLGAAKHFIDLLDVVEKKTTGNLTDDEKKVLGSVLYELRMQYVHVVQGPMPDAAGR